MAQKSNTHKLASKKVSTKLEPQRLKGAEKAILNNDITMSYIQENQGISVAFIKVLARNVLLML